MDKPSHRFGWYLALVQLLFTLCWTVYAIYLPQLAASAGIPASAVPLVLMLDQIVFTACDFATGIAADRITRGLGLLGPYVTAATVLSCLAFLALPFLADAGAATFLGLTLLWTTTSSALRAPPLTLLGKYAARPAHASLAGIALLGYGFAGALAPYLALLLRERDPRLPFTLASLSLALATLGMIAAERDLKAKETAPPRTVFGGLDRRAASFALGVLVLAAGYQIHFALQSAALFRRFAPPTELPWLMPIFWVGFNVAMVAAGPLARRLGGTTAMGGAALIGALALVVAHMAPGLGALTMAEFFAGGAWGAMLMSAFVEAFAAGAGGGEGRLTGILFSALAAATLGRVIMAAVDPGLGATLPWLAVLLWTTAGAALLAAGRRAP